MTAQPCISISGLTKKYQGSSSFALAGLDLGINEGEVFGILGPNGAGKTTFLSILCGLVKPTSGMVTLFGYPVEKGIENIKKIMGVVPQDIALYPTLTGRDNLLYIGRMYGLHGKPLIEKVDYYLNRFGFGNSAKEQVKTYSGGMKRRINLIGGILHNPKVLLLDEPTVGMDVQSRTSMIDHLRELNHENKMTILYTSHYMEQAEVLCDRVAIIDKGQILLMGTPKDLMEQENTNDLEDVFIKLTGKKIRD